MRTKKKCYLNYILEIQHLQRKDYKILNVRILIENY